MCCKRGDCSDPVSVFCLHYTWILPHSASHIKYILSIVGAEDPPSREEIKKESFKITVHNDRLIIRRHLDPEEKPLFASEHLLSVCGHVVSVQQEALQIKSKAAHCRWMF